MKLAILCEYILPENGAVVNRMIHFATFFARYGIKTTILAPQRKDLPSFHVSPQVEIIRYANLRHLFYLLKRARVHLILASSPAPKYPFFASIIARILRIPCVVDVRDPPAYVMKHCMKLSPFTYQYIKTFLLEFTAYRLATEIFIVSKYQRMILSRMFHIPSKKFTIIINGGQKELSYYDLNYRKSTRANLNLNEDAVVLFFNGALGGYIFEEMLRAIGDSLFKNPHVFLLIITSFFHNEKILRKIREFFEHKSYNRQFILMDAISSNEMAKYLSAADIGLLPVDLNWHYSIPAKSFEFMLAQLPVAVYASPRMPIFRMVKKLGFGIASSYWDEFKGRLIELIENPQIRKSIGINGKNIAEQHLLRDFATQIALRRIKELVLIG